MNKTLLLLIAGIVVVGGLVGYTMFGTTSNDAAHTAGDGHTDADHAETTTGTAPHDDTGTAPHAEPTSTVPHDDTGSAPHTD